MSVPGVIKAVITGCCSKRSTGGRQGGHSRLYIRSIAALGNDWGNGCVSMESESQRIGGEAVFQ